MVRIYGEFSQESSQSVVARGFASVFGPEAHYCDLSKWGNDLDDAQPEDPGASDRVGIFVGSLSHLAQALRAGHEAIFVMVAPNSNTVGGYVKLALTDPRVSLLAPSRWGAEVLRKEFPSKIVLTVPHGVSKHFRPPAGEHPGSLQRQFRVLHMSSSLLQRKGTEELLRAWCKVARHDWTLFVSVPTDRVLHFRSLLAELQMPPELVQVTGRLGYSDERMAELYQQMSYVCQPSRGEGFGMVPLEARACGTPVIMTTCTGHSEHCHGPGVVPVSTGELSAIDDFPGAMAPHLRVEAVAEALEEAYVRRDIKQAEAMQAAADIGEKWSWENQLAAFHTHITEEDS